MASKRMFSREAIGSDAFADMSFEAQALYVHLSMDADDWGFVGSPRKVQRGIGAGPGALDELAQSEFVHVFGSGVLVILDWWVNNTIPEKRRRRTQHQEELGQLTLTESGVYQLVCDVSANCVQIADKPQQNACDFIASTVEVSREEKRKDKKKGPERKAYGEYRNVMLSDEELEKLQTEFPDWEERIEACSSYCASKGKRYKNYLATIRSWARRDGKGKAVRDGGVFDAIGAAIGS